MPLTLSEGRGRGSVLMTEKGSHLEVRETCGLEGDARDGQAGQDLGHVGGALRSGVESLSRCGTKHGCSLSPNCLEFTHSA